MGGIDRRHMVLGSGMALALAGLGGGRAKAQPSNPPGQGPFEDGWNQGNQPWNSHPNGMAQFDPDYTAILHMNFTNSGLQAKRIHFTAVRNMGVNNWGTNRAKVIAFLKYLNGFGSSPDVHTTYPGLVGFAFSEAHHFVIYVQNKGTSYVKDREIWFGKKLVTGMYGVNVASKNESFFDTRPDSESSISNGSTNMIYVKNYFHVGDGNGNNHRPIQRGERFVYALKINALMTSVLDTSTLRIPMLIDPDTGNMGEGHPFLTA